MKNNTKYIIITGGVLSGLGKGVLTASIGSILTMMGFKCNIKKITEFPNISKYLESLYAIKAVKSTLNIDHIKLDVISPCSLKYQ